LSNFSLQFAQNLNLGRSSCDTLSLAFTVYVQIQLADCSKNTICGDPIVIPLVSSSPCMSNFSLQFVQNHSPVGLPLVSPSPCMSDFKLTLCSKTRSGETQLRCLWSCLHRVCPTSAYRLFKNTIWGDPVVMPLGAPPPCMSNFSVKFVHKHNLGKSSCDASGAAFTLNVQLQLAVCSKTQSGEIQL
jgi:hypothetical protein